MEENTLFWIQNIIVSLTLQKDYTLVLIYVLTLFLVVPTVDDFANTLLGLEKKYIDEDTQVDGGLIDSYVAGHDQEKLKESVGLRVGTVFDHQFAYGFVITNELLNNQNIERCLRRTLSTQESMITSKIQEDMNALPVS